MKRLRYENGPIDRIDARILDVLTADARTSIAEIARTLGGFGLTVLVRGESHGTASLTRDKSQSGALRTPNRTVRCKPVRPNRRHACLRSSFSGLVLSLACSISALIPDAFSSISSCLRA